MPFSASDLIFNTNGSIYHLNVLPGEVAETIILVGDPDRVTSVSKHFDQVEIKKHKREFVVHTGYIGQLRISVIATGIGSGNIDIVMNEVDALFNIDFSTRQVKEKITTLRFIRLGTCGSLNKNMVPDDIIFSRYAFALDGLLNYYQRELGADEDAILQQIQTHFAALPMVNNASVASSAQALLPQLTAHYHQGITLTCQGFYGPQSRQLRKPIIDVDIFKMASNIQFESYSVTNLEMETAAIYGLGKVFGHECYSFSCVLANRILKKVSHDPEKAVGKMITGVFDLLSSRYS